MTDSDAKICGLCGEDCSDRARTRDRRGRYFCNRCYEQAVARAKNNQTDAALSADTQDVDATVLAAILERVSPSEAPPPEAHEVCHRCGKAFEVGDAVCSRCGDQADPRPAPKPEFAAATPPTGHWHIPTWVLVVVPLVAIVAIVFAAMPGKRRAPATVAPSLTGETALAAPLDAPDLAAPATFESGAIEFQYPGNWRIDKDYPGFNRDEYIVVDNTRNAQMIIHLQESGRSVDVELAAKLATLRGSGRAYTDGKAMETYGTLTGVGRTVTTYSGTTPSRYRMFVARMGLNRLIEIHETCPNADLENAEPGFDFIAASLAPK